MVKYSRLIKEEDEVVEDEVVEDEVVKGPNRLIVKEEQSMIGSNGACGSIIQKKLMIGWTDA